MVTPADIPIYLHPDDWPKTDHLITDEPAHPVSFYCERQMRLLVEPLYTSWSSPAPFFAGASNALFYRNDNPPAVPDFCLKLDETLTHDRSVAAGRAYLNWDMGMPDLIIEIVSD